VTTFDRAVKLVLRHEGGYANDSHDAGGETKFGISKRSYPALDIRALTELDAVALYRRDYWDALRCDAMPPSVALVVFDGAVNQGRYAVTLDLQGALGVKADGILGPITLAAVSALPARDVLPRLVARRSERYALHWQLSRYGLGWFTRLADVTITAAGLL
jgi:lysozyme family protein